MKTGNFLILLWISLFILNFGIKAQQAVERVTPIIDKDTAWYEVNKWGIEGKGWQETKRYYDRLPAKAEKIVRKEVWDLSRHSAGMSVKFSANTEEIYIRYKLLSSKLEMTHMPATGVSGADLYAETKDGKWEWLANTKPRNRIVHECLISKLPNEKRNYVLYLPLYNGIDSLEIGVPKDAAFKPVTPRKVKPIVFYGTSIMQGGCASRPGMAFTNILERRLNIPIINLGFSGNGRMDTSVAELLSELDPCLYIIDCLPNMRTKEVTARTQNLVNIIRKEHRVVPILLVEDRTLQGCMFTQKTDSLHTERRAALKDEYNKLLSSGIKDLYYLEGKDLLGNDGEGTVDGSHPTDLGMVRYADTYEPVLRKILKIKK